VVGIAMDLEGIEPAKKYYERFGVTFHALVDPNFATRFSYVPWTFFVNEHGVVQKTKNWENRLKPATELQPVTEAIRNQWTGRGERQDPKTLAAYVERLKKDPADLAAAVDLGSRYLDTGRLLEARRMLKTAVAQHDAAQVDKKGSAEQKELLAAAWFQLARTWNDDREKQVEAAKMAYNLKPTIGLAKQITRIIDPDKFDKTPNGRLDNTYRNAKAREIKNEREAWRKR
ncbi:MAG: hypothetical protein AAF492_21485, partial [Verrucomicrobiota bacterium]